MNAYQLGEKLLRGAYSSYTPTGKSYFVNAHHWGTIPHRGDVVYFYNKSLGRVAHVGIVRKVQKYSSGKYFIETVEGNTTPGKMYERDGGEVSVKEYSFYLSDVGKSSINGFGTPDFSGTGITVEQFIKAAEAWLGYAEKASDGTDEQLKDKAWNPGDKNYTWCGRWYWLNPAQWCQMFVSYCAYEAAKMALQGKETGWMEGPAGVWHYRKENGNLAANEWLFVNGRWYVFDASGNMITGWFRQRGEEWYYLAEDGGMLSSQWLKQGGKWFYLTASGLMATNAYVKGTGPSSQFYYWVNAEGEWEPYWDTRYPDLEKYEVAL